LNIGFEVDVIGYSRTSRAALAPFRRPQIDQRRTGAVFVGALDGKRWQGPVEIWLTFSRRGLDGRGQKSASKEAGTTTDATTAATA
jgi:hypothetical protein